MEINNCVFEGRVVSWNDAIKVYNQDDEAKCVVRTDITQKFNGKKDENGYYPDHTIPLTLFGKTAVNFVNFVHPGDKITVVCEYRQGEKFTDQNGVTKRNQTFIVRQFNRVTEKSNESNATQQPAAQSFSNQTFGAPPVQAFGAPPQMVTPPPMPGIPQMNGMPPMPNMMNAGFVPSNLR